MADDSLFLIDIDKILRKRLRSSLSIIPKFVVSYLGISFCQRGIECLFAGVEDKVSVDFLKACLEFLDAILVKGRKICLKRALYFCIQPSLGGQDGVALGYVLEILYGGKVERNIWSTTC